MNISKSALRRADSGSFVQEREKVVIGIDIGGVITAGGNEIFTDKFLEGPQMLGAFEAIRKLVAHFGSENVFLVSKCKEKMQKKTTQWLLHHNFYALTGVKERHLYYCEERHEKAPICQKLGITHFIDDRLEVLSYLLKLTPPIKNLYLFKPSEKEVRKHAQYLSRVTRVEAWAELVKILLP